MKVAASLFSLFGRVGRLGAISPITQGEIAQEISYRNYTTGQATEPVPTTITRADAIKYAVNKGLDSSGLARQASTLTYLDVMQMSTLISFCTTWANWYLAGTQTPASSVMGLRGIRGRNMRGLGVLPEDTTFNPDAWIPASPQPGFSGWGLLLTLVGQGVISYGNYLLAKQAFLDRGYSMNTTASGMTQEQLIQQIMVNNPSLSYQQARDMVYGGGAKEGTPQWVWIAGGLAAVYLLTQRKTA